MKNELTVTNKEVAESTGAVGGQAQRDDLPGILQYRLARLVDLVNPIAKAYQRGRNRIVKEYALRTADGEFVWQNGVEGQHQIDPDRMDEFQAEIDELDAVEHTISFIPIRAKALFDKKGSIPNGGGMVLSAMKPFLDLSDLEDEYAALEREEG